MIDSDFEEQPPNPDSLGLIPYFEAPVDEPNPGSEQNDDCK